MTSQSSVKTVVRPSVSRSRGAFWRAETIGQRLSLGFLMILLVLAAYGAVALTGLERVGTDVVSMEAESGLAMEAAHLQRLSETVLVPVRDYLLTGDPEAETRFEELAGQLDASLALFGVTSVPMGSEAMPSMEGMGETQQPAPPQELEGAAMEHSIVLAPEEMELLQQVGAAWTTVRTGANRIFLMPAAEGNEAALETLAELEPQAQRMAAFAQSLHQGGMKNVRLGRESANATTRNITLFLVAAVLSAIAVSVLLTWLITRAISRPIVQLTDMATAISLGELDTKLEVRAKGEVGELAQSIERMRTSLKMTIERLSEEEEDLRTWTAHLVDREIRRKVRAGTIALGGKRYEVGRDLDGQSVFIKLDLDLREIVVTPSHGDSRHLPLKA